VWTTNYDALPEVAWRHERKELDVKSRNDDLGTDKPWAHAILYKMHGSVDHPSEVVIAKDDYELYRRSRPGFLQVLTGHLVSKQMLFLGFSFSDPNIAHLFASIREAFKDNGPEHHAIVRHPKLSSGRGAKKRLEVDEIRHALWVEDLKRYGIQCVEVDEYKDVDDILRALELRLAGRSVFVSGSLAPSAELDQRDYVEDVAREVGRVIAEHENDAASTTNAKTAAAVRIQAPIVVANLFAAMKGEPLPKAYDGYGSCPLTVAYGKIVLAEFAYGGKVTPSFPLDPRVPRRSMWLLKTKLLPWLYWSHMFKGGEFDIPHRPRGW
jgi:hypothetical protein